MENIFRDIEQCSVMILIQDDSTVSNIYELENIPIFYFLI